MGAAEIIVPIMVALITSAGASIAGIVQLVRLRKENSEQHSSAVTQIEHTHSLIGKVHDDVRDIRSNVEQVRSDLDRHLGEHDAGKPFRRIK